jgi:hypothetical protein
MQYTIITSPNNITFRHRFSVIFQSKLLVIYIINIKIYMKLACPSSET